MELNEKKAYKEKLETAVYEASKAGLERKELTDAFNAGRFRYKCLKSLNDQLSYESKDMKFSDEEKEKIIDMALANQNVASKREECLKDAAIAYETERAQQELDYAKDAQDITHDMNEKSYTLKEYVKEALDYFPDKDVANQLLDEIEKNNLFSSEQKFEAIGIANEDRPAEATEETVQNVIDVIDHYMLFKDIQHDASELSSLPHETQQERAKVMYAAAEIFNKVGKFDEEEHSFSTR